MRWLQIVTHACTNQADLQQLSWSRPACYITTESKQSTTLYHVYYRCIRNDMKAAACHSLNCIKNKTKIKYGENDFQYDGWNYYTLQCGTIMTLISVKWLHPDCGMWLRNHDSEFTKWHHPVMWQVAYAMEFAQTSAILEFYIWFRFWPYHRSRHFIMHQSAKFYPNRTTLSRKKWRHVDFLDGGSQPCWILGVQ